MVYKSVRVYGWSQFALLLSRFVPANHVTFHVYFVERTVLERQVLSLQTDTCGTSIRFLGAGFSAVSESLCHLLSACKVCCHHQAPFTGAR